MELGRVVQTRGIYEATQSDDNFSKEVQEAFSRYMAKDWGDLCEEDKQLNDDALTNGDRILAAYKTSRGKLYIITEWDRSSTCILFADEY